MDEFDSSKNSLKVELNTVKKGSTVGDSGKDFFFLDSGKDRDGNKCQNRRQDNLVKVDCQSSKINGVKKEQK